MSVEIQNINDSERTIKIEMPKEETQSYFEEILKEEAKKISLPGFRKGKAPISLIKKMYGDAIFYDKLDKIAENKFWDEIQTTGLEVIGIPKLTHLDLTEEGGLNFQIQFEIIPEIKIENLEDIEIEQEEYELSDTFIEKALEYLRFMSRTEEPAEKVESMDYIVNLEVSDREDTSKPSEKILVYLKNENLNPEFANLLLGKNLNDEFDSSIPLSAENSSSEENQEKKSTNYHYKIIEIKKVILPELNDEFAQKSSNGKIQTLEELKKTLAEDELKYYQRNAKNKLVDSIRDAFVKKFDFTPPPTLVERQKQYLIDYLKKQTKANNLDQNSLETISKIAEEDTKWFLIKQEIISKYNLRLTPEEIEKYAEELSEKYQKDKEEMRRFLTSRRSALLDELENEKFMNFILSKVKVNIKKVNI
ncbi:MAG: trigger factor [Ignavibacteria bacterium]|nr:trigger factor [Ignavibacteria bacterium]